MVSARRYLCLFLVGILLSCGTGTAAAATGADWSLANASAGFPARIEHVSVVFNNEMWVIAGASATSVLNDTWHSSDGNVWSEANASAGFVKRTGASGVVFDGRIWLIAGNDGSHNRNDVWYSSDGSIWTLANASPAFSARTGSAAVVYNNMLWLTGGYTGSAPVNEVWYSSDGSIWTLANASPMAAPPDFPERSYHTMVVYNNRMWILGGSSSGGEYLNDTWYSTDGITWTWATDSAAFSGRAYHSSVVSDDRMWVLAGQKSPSYTSLNDTWYSSDGSTWTAATVAAAFPARYHQTSLAYGEKMWVIGGTDDTHYYNDTWYSEVPVPVPTTQSPESSSGSASTTQSSVLHARIGGAALAFTFGYPLSTDDFVRIESVEIVPVAAFSGDIQCLVTAGSPGSTQMVTGQPVAGYQDITLNWIRADNVQSRVIRFSVSEDWPDLKGRSPEEIVMLRYSGGTWTAVPTVFEKQENGRLYFHATSPGFSLFAVGLENVSVSAPETPVSVANTTPAATPGDEVAGTPVTLTAPASSPVAAAATPVQPNATVTGTSSGGSPRENAGSGFPVTIIGIIGCIVLVAAGAILLRRWWIRRQNPSLFRKY